MSGRFQRLVLFMVLFMSSMGAHAVILEYRLSDLGAGRYQYDYTLTNDSRPDIYGFTAWFDTTLYANLSLVSSPAGWATFVFSDPPAIYDSLGPDLILGESQDGFSVSFDWLGAGVPGSQGFVYYSNCCFPGQFDGVTTLAATPAPVPAPASWAMMLVVVGLCALRRRFR